MSFYFRLDFGKASASQPVRLIDIRKRAVKYMNEKGIVKANRKKDTCIFFAVLQIAKATFPDRRLRRATIVGRK
jgi:hypothetical protein